MRSSASVWTARATGKGSTPAASAAEIALPAVELDTSNGSS